MLRFAKSSVHFTRCFEGQVHQVLFLCSEDGLYHIEVGTLYARGIFRNKLERAGGSKINVLEIEFVEKAWSGESYILGGGFTHDISYMQGQICHN